MNRFIVTVLILTLSLVTLSEPLFASSEIAFAPAAATGPLSGQQTIIDHTFQTNKAQTAIQASESTPTAIWQQLTLPTAIMPSTVANLVVHPQSAAILYLATQQGLYQSNDAGNSWQRFDSLGDRQIFELAQAEANPQRLYLRSWESYRSDDGGATWHEFTKPAEACGFVVAPSQPDRLYARRCAPADLPPVIRSDDGGQSWIIPTNGMTVAFDSIVVAPDQPNTLIASNFDQTWHSTDAGESWSQVSIGVRYFGKPIFDRQTPPNLYLGHWTGLLRSRDSGGTWEDSGAAREFSTLIPLADEHGTIVGGNNEALWQFQAEDERWQATSWSAPAGMEALWSSAHDGDFIYMRTTDELWRLRLAPMEPAVAFIYLPLIQKAGLAIAATDNSGTCGDGCQAFITETTEEIGQSIQRGDTTPSPATQAIERANHYRAIVGVTPFTAHPALTTATENHANYYRLNATDNTAWAYGSHGEVEGKPGYTGQWPKDRLDAASYPWLGGAEVIHWLGDPIASVDDWIATVYHRFPILDPYHHYVGYGHISGGSTNIDVMDFGTGPTAAGAWIAAHPHPLAYPVDGQTDVPPRWSGAESPSPLPPGASGPVGYPFTLQAIGGELTVTHAELRTTDGQLVATHPNPPDCAAGRCLALMAVAPLTAHTTYVVTAAGNVRGVPFQREWRFTTGADTSTVNAATTALERASGPISAHEPLQQWESAPAR